MPKEIYRKCDLHTGASRIRKGLEHVEQTWQDASDAWNDEASHRFRREHLEPLVPEVKLALEAIARMQLVMDQMQKEMVE